MLSGAVTEATVDVYSTVDENLLSKFDISLAIDPSAIPGGEVVPVDSIDIDFGFEIGDINEEQTIEAPSDAQPLDELLGASGLDLGGLGGASTPEIPGAGGGAGRRRRCRRGRCLPRVPQPGDDARRDQRLRERALSAAARTILSDRRPRARVAGAARISAVVTE